MKFIFTLAIVFLTACSTPQRYATSDVEAARALATERPIFLPGRSKPLPRTSLPNDSGSNYAPVAPVSPGAGFAPPNASLKPAQLFYDQLTDSSFNDVATLSEGFIKGAVVKFLIDRRSPQYPKVYFINGNYLDSSGQRPQYSQFHYYFAQKQLGIKYSPEQFNQMTYFTNDPNQKKFIAGTIQKYQSMADSEMQPFYGIQFYPQDFISQQMVLTAVEVVRKHIQFTEGVVKVVSSGIQQNFSEIGAGLENLNVTPTTIEKIYAGIPYIPMQQGETYGTLRFQPSSSTLLKPNDIPVFSELPLDLSVVAGVITTVIQDAGSHINLKSKERGTPNVVVRDLSRIAELKNLDGQPVQLIVSDQNFTINKVSKTVVDDFWAKKLKTKKWTLIKNGNAQNAVGFDDIATQLKPSELVLLSSSYGGKASKLAFLASPEIAGIDSEIQKSLGYRLTPVGFGIPVSWYLKFVNSNEQLKSNIDILVRSFSDKKDKTKKVLTELEKNNLILKIQNQFLQTPFPSELIPALQQQILSMQQLNKKYFPNSEIKKVKVRSSANAEDIQDFDGAGLHSSYSAKLSNLGTSEETCRYAVDASGVVTKDDIEPDTMICAIKGVYASLWNSRAVDERAFAKIDQSTAAMGIAVNNSYDFRKKENITEIANGVVVTRVINAKGVYGYRASFNTKDNLVTNPTPGTQSEIVLATFISTEEVPQFSFLQFAKIEKEGEILEKPLLSETIYKNIIRIAQNVESNYCKEIKGYYAGQCSYVAIDPDKPRSLDMEFKIYSNGEVLLKQVREFSGQ